MKQEIKVGDMVTITGNKNDHEFEIGEEVRILTECSSSKEGFYYSAINSKGDEWFIWPSEFVITKSKASEGATQPIANDKAKRYNTGKLRYGLIPQWPLAAVADVFTRGAHKYTVYQDESGVLILGKDIPFEEVASRKLTIIDDGADNWRKGQDWMSAMESHDRHIAAYKSGEDMDELGTYHLANAVWQGLVLLEYYKTHPELDNRKHKYLTTKKIGLDIDEVCADFVAAIMREFPHIKDRPVYWNDHDLGQAFREIQDNQTFWLGIPPKINPLTLPFEPHCYITSRSIDSDVTKEWLRAHGFPERPVYTVGHGVSKVEAAKASGLDIYVDDRYENFVELNAAGICCYLMDAPHNQRYNVGYKRIKSLNELV